jgi:hypothetical protein
MPTYEELLAEKIIKLLTSPEDWVRSDSDRIHHIPTNLTIQIFDEGTRITLGFNVVFLKSDIFYEKFNTATKYLLKQFEQKKAQIILEQLAGRYKYSFKLTDMATIDKSDYLVMITKWAREAELNDIFLEYKSWTIWFNEKTSAVLYQTTYGGT